ncbi:shikimate kinase [Pontiella agarivorans]|uniref:Shikimate kinase n=1 Tax=Pontiella agarivorans TaxID=3038953 RepID=A0ABU5MUP0_9BACT|nr:shikimate kinase [Pontiella agarivorans]MDZ8117686.1 shikimate kinase [Pontiella agarivorans]
MAETNIVLIGMPASGKSTLGVQLAKWLSKGFIDTDLLVQARAGESMQAFQDRDGLTEYQKLECATVQSVVCENCVIATGGSAVYCDGAMAHLKSIASVVFLDVPLDEILRRIGDFSERGVVIRPGMTLADLYEERRPLYLRHADHVIACSGKAQDELLREIRGVL